MRRNFVLDKEIVLDEQSDFLKTKVYSDNLNKIIKNTPPDKVFTIGLFGSWGSGKSSIIETCKHDFDLQKSPKVHFVTYDAWQYCNDSFRRMFLRHLRSSLNYKETDYMRKFYENESIDIGKKYQLNNTKMIQVIIVLLIMIAIVASLRWWEISDNWKFSIASLIPLCGLLYTIISGVFQELKISVTKPHLFAPEQFEDCFKEIVNSSFEKTNSISRFKYKYIDNNKGIKDLDKLVIVIDNIDRCDSNIAYQLLTDIKTFLCDEQLSVVFIIPVDDEALQKHLFNRKSDETEEFLRKFFNVVIRIKPYGTTEMRALANRVNENSSLGYNSETLNLLSKEFARNPRRIIQLFNNLSAELNNYDDDFSDKYETLICALLIIREEYNDYYKMLITQKKLILDGIYSSDPEENDACHKDLKTFLRTTKHITKGVETSVITKILTNADSIYNDIPDEIQDEIVGYNSDVLLKYLSENPDKEEIVYSYISDQLKEVYTYNIKSEIVNYFDLIAKLNVVKPMPSHINISIVNSINNNFEDIISETADVKSICAYSKILLDQEVESLKNYLFQYITTTNEDGVPANLDIIRTEILKLYQDETFCHELSSFMLKHLSTEWIDRDVEYSEHQWQHLISSNVITNYIDAIETISLEDNNADEVLWIFQTHPHISSFIIKTFLNKINDLIGDMRNKTKDEILEYIHFLTPYFSTIGDRTLEKEPSEIYRKIFDDRKKAHPSYPTSPQYDTDVSFITETIDNKEEAQAIIDFIILIYSTTNNHTSTNSELAIYAPKYRGHTNQHLVKLLDKGFSLVPLFNIILTDTYYFLDSSLRLTKHCLTYKNKDGKLEVANNKIIEKLNSLISSVTSSTRTQVIDLILFLCDNVAFKKIMSNKIKSLTVNKLKDYPLSLFNIPLSDFSNRTVVDLSTESGYYTLLAKRAKDSILTDLILILRQKVTSNDNIDIAITIINEFANRTDISKSKLRGIKNDLSAYKTNDKNLKRRIKRVSSKI